MSTLDAAVQEAKDNTTTDSSPVKCAAPAEAAVPPPVDEEATLEEVKLDVDTSETEPPTPDSGNTYKHKRKRSYSKTRQSRFEESCEKSM